jgi:hypothetical protein
MKTLGVPFLVVVQPACFAAGFLFAFRVGRKVESRFVLHGTLVGVVATILYLLLVVAQPGSWTVAINLYGPVLFVLANSLRVAGSVAGGVAAGRRAVAAASV